MFKELPGGQKNKTENKEGREPTENKNKMADLIILNVSSLNILITRQRLAGWMKNHDSTICCLKDTYFKYQHIDGLKILMDKEQLYYFKQLQSMNITRDKEIY